MQPAVTCRCFPVGKQHLTCSNCHCEATRRQRIATIVFSILASSTGLANPSRYTFLSSIPSHRGTTANVFQGKAPMWFSNGAWTAFWNGRLRPASDENKCVGTFRTSWGVCSLGMRAVPPGGAASDTTVSVQWRFGDALLVVKFAIQGLAMWSVRFVTGSLPAAPHIQQFTMRLDNVLMLPCARMAAAAGFAAWCRGGESSWQRRTCREILCGKPKEGQHRQAAVLQLLQLVLLELRAV